MKLDADSLLPDLLETLNREVGRRGLLQASMSGIALVLLGGILPSGCRRYPEPPVKLRFFSPENYAVFQEISRALLGLDGEAVDVAVEVDHLVAGMDRSVQRDIRWILRIFEHGTHFFDLKGRRFTRLDRKDQEKYLAGWMQSSMGARRIIFRALKLMASLGYYRLPQTWPAIGYDGPWLGRREESRLGSYEDPTSLEVFVRG